MGYWPVNCVFKFGRRCLHRNTSKDCGYRLTVRKITDYTLSRYVLEWNYGSPSGSERFIETVAGRTCTYNLLTKWECVCNISHGRALPCVIGGKSSAKKHCVGLVTKRHILDVMLLSRSQWEFFRMCIKSFLVGGAAVNLDNQPTWSKHRECHMQCAMWHLCDFSLQNRSCL